MLNSPPKDNLEQAWVSFALVQGLAKEGKGGPTPFIAQIFIWCGQ